MHLKCAMAWRAWVSSYKKHSDRQATRMVRGLAVLGAGWASCSSAWACCGQRLSQSKCILHGCRRILAQLNIRLLRAHPSQCGIAEEGKAGLFLPLIYPVDILGQCWYETGFSLASCFRFCQWRWGHQRSDGISPWGCVSPIDSGDAAAEEKWSCRGDTVMRVAEEHRYLSCWERDFSSDGKPHCTRGSKEKSGMLPGQLIFVVALYHLQHWDSNVPPTVGITVWNFGSVTNNSQDQSFFISRTKIGLLQPYRVHQCLSVCTSHQDLWTNFRWRCRSTN